MRDEVVIAVIIPSDDANGLPIAQLDWCAQATEMLRSLYGNGNVVATACGTAYTETPVGAMSSAALPRVVYATVSEAVSRDADRLGMLSSFLRRFGREAKQPEVGVVVGNYYYALASFDAAAGR